MIDLQLLRILKHRAEYYKVIDRVPKETIDEATRALLKDFGKYFERFPDHERINMQTFAPLFSSWHPKLTLEKRQHYAELLKKAHKDVPDEERDGIMQSLLELRLASDLANILLRFEEGELENINSAIDNATTSFRIDARVRGLDYVRPDVTKNLEQEINDEGLHWRLECLNRSMRGLRPGDFGILAMRPDKGKTTMVASEITHMAAQTDRPILWLNNEGPGDRIYTRLWQAALGMKMSELIDLHKANNLIQSYEKAVKGDQFKIKVFDIHGMDNYAVERIVEQNKPALVVYDMIDNIRGFSDAGRTDERLEKMYQWARELAVKYEFAGIATSQISVEGANTMYPPDSALKDSKTGKQGACDFIIMGGSVDDPGYKSQRFIGVPKNKLRREGADGDPRCPVHFKPQIARLEDIMETEYDEE